MTKNEAAAAMGRISTPKKAEAARKNGAKGGRPSMVTIWQDTRGGKIAVCERCQRKLQAGGQWPRNAQGEEYATVSRGMDKGRCQIHRHDPEIDAELNIR